MFFKDASPDVGGYIRSLLKCPQLARQITHHRLVSGSSAEYAESRIAWPRAVNNLLKQKGLRLYSHQALATDHIRAGHSVVVATPTASGKSLVYNLPVLAKYLQDPDARALYLFPLKALAQDQLAAFRNLCALWPEDARPEAALYDGDTGDHQRRKIRRDPPCALITNPEMLHLAIMPYHEQWATFLAGLTHVIVDEAHTYRGVFGSHMAQVFRRLNRLVARYGARPSYILCTATLGNPQELAANLIGAESPPVLIDKSGAPCGPKHFLFINPEMSAATCAIDLLKRALEKNLRVIVYCRSRRMTELISIWAAGESGKWKKSISSYRAGFLPEERRDIEARMASGDLKAVVSTSALELGIDIGGLDVCILVGYPGTIMQTLQRGGRVGRQQRESALLIVAGEDALDQYFARHPEDFFTRPPEKAVINPDNEVILARHLECAAAEMPLSVNEPWLARPGVVRALRELSQKGLLLQSADGSRWLAARKRPQRDIDLRGCGAAYLIEDERGRVIGHMDGYRVWRETHPGAVYIHHGQTYVIDRVDSGKMRILAKAAKVSWFTRARGGKSTDILEEYERVSLGSCLICRGRLRITEIISGYEKRSSSGNRLLTIAPLQAPPHVFETEGIWLVIPDDMRRRMEDRFLHFMGSIHALEHAIIGILPLEVMADRNDFGGISIPLHPQLGLPAVFVYDSLPGGAALTKAAFADARRVLLSTQKAIADCPCESGCPSCVHSPKCGSGNRPISKEGALELLNMLLAPGTEGDILYESLVMSRAIDRIAPQFTQETPVETPAETPPEDDRHKDGYFDYIDGQLLPAPYESPVDGQDIITGVKVPEDEEAMPMSLNDYDDDDDDDDDVYIGEEAEDILSRSYLAWYHDWLSAELEQGPKYEPPKPPEGYVVFDVETRLSAAEVGGWENCDKMGVSVAVLYESASDKYFAYEQHQLDDLFRKMLDASLVIGFNSLRFDYKVLEPFFTAFQPGMKKGLHALPSLDLLQDIKATLGFPVSLDNLGKTTLNSAKSADGLKALRWWQEGKIREIADYCKKDVELAKELYLFGLRNGRLFFRNKRGQKVSVQVNFEVTAQNAKTGS